jgi:hypothetical protein
MLWDLIRRAAERGHVHGAVAVNTGGSGKRTVVSSSVTEGGQMEDKDDRSELTDEELEQQEGEELPERTQMSIVHLPAGATLPIVPPEID